MRQNIKTITDNITFLPASEAPLSADVYFIKGKERTYIIDVGSNDEALNLVEATENKTVIITHFHEDHASNLKRIEIDDSDLLVGDYTNKVYNKGTLIKEPALINDGVTIKVFAIANSHAKGSLCVTVNDEYLFIGDSYYCSAKGYNVSLLHDEIEFLRDLDFTKVICSHEEKIHTKEEVIKELEECYSKREAGNPYIKLW